LLYGCDESRELTFYTATFLKKKKKKKKGVKIAQIYKNFKLLKK